MPNLSGEDQAVELLVLGFRECDFRLSGIFPAFGGDVVLLKEIQPKQYTARQREAKSKILAPPEKELETLEAKIAEQEAAQATLTAALSSEEISGDADKLRQTTNAVEKVTKTLELAYARGSSLTEEIEQMKAKHGL